MRGINHAHGAPPHHPWVGHPQKTTSLHCILTQARFPIQVHGVLGVTSTNRPIVSIITRVLAAPIPVVTCHYKGNKRHSHKYFQHLWRTVCNSTAIWVSNTPFWGAPVLKGSVTLKHCSPMEFQLFHGVEPPIVMNDGATPKLQTLQQLTDLCDRVQKRHQFWFNSNAHRSGMSSHVS